METVIKGNSGVFKIDGQILYGGNQTSYCNSEGGDHSSIIGNYKGNLPVSYRFSYIDEYHTNIKYHKSVQDSKEIENGALSLESKSL